MGLWCLLRALLDTMLRLVLIATALAHAHQNPKTAAATSLVGEKNVKTQAKKAPEVLSQYSMCDIIVSVNFQNHPRTRVDMVENGTHKIEVVTNPIHEPVAVPRPTEHIRKRQCQRGSWTRTRVCKARCPITGPHITICVHPSGRGHTQCLV